MLFLGVAALIAGCDDGRGGGDRNAPPEPVADQATTPEDQSVVIDVLANDADPEGDVVFVTEVEDGAHGTVTVALDGTLTYTPDPDYAGPDQFTYTVGDGEERDELPSATVDVTVAEIGDAPVAIAEDYEIEEDGQLVAGTLDGVLGNDADVDSTSLTAVLVSDVFNGTLSLAADGSFTYEPAANYAGADSFTYHVSDGALTSADVTVDLTVVSVNDAPVASADEVFVTEDEMVAVEAPGVLGNDGDVEDDLLEAVPVATPAKGTLSLMADGSFTYVPFENEIGADAFTYRVDDGQAMSEIVTVSITIADVPPVISIADASAVSEGGAGAEGQATFVVSLSETSVQDTTVDWTITDGTTDGASDYAASSGTLTITAGEASANLVVALAADGVNEADESFTVTLSNEMNGTLADGAAVGTILDDDTTTVVVGPATVLEGDVSATIVFPIRLSAPSEQLIVVDVETGDGTATLEDTDYLSTTDTVMLVMGSGAFPVGVTGDDWVEDDETVRVRVTSVTGRGVSMGDDGFGTIENDDFAGLVTWTGAGMSGNFSDPANWDTGAVPGRSDIAVFDGTSGLNCGIDVPAEIAGVVVDATYGGSIGQQTAAPMTIRPFGWSQLGGEATMGGDVRIDGDLRVVSPGSFFSAEKISLRGDVDVSEGTFHAISGSELVLEGTGAQTVSGLAFTWHVTVQNESAPVRFLDGFEVQGTFSALAENGDIDLELAEGQTVRIRGPSGFLRLVGTAPHRVVVSDGAVNATNWTLEVDATATTEIERIDVQGCQAAGSGAPLVAVDSIDSGNNVNWIFQ